MGLHWLDWLVLLVYFVGVILLGVWARKLIKTQGDFLLGGRRFSGKMLAFLSFGSGTHTDQAVLTSSAAYQYGFSGVWMQLLWLFVTPFYWLMAPIYRRARCYTCSDIYERRFGQVIAGLYTLMGILTMSLVMGMMLKAATRMFTGMIGGSADLFALGGITITTGDLTIAIMTLLFVVYGVLGGLVAAVWTDVLQGVLTIVLSFLMIPFALAKVGGFAGFHAQMPNHDQMFALINQASGIGIFFIVMTVINGIINNAGQAGTITGFAAGKTEVEGRVGKVYGNMLKRFCIVGWAMIGVIGIILYPGKASEEVFGFAANALLPVGLVGLMLAAAMAAMMSTCDVMMVTSAGLFTENFWKRYIFPKNSESHYVKVNRIASVIIVVLGLIFAYGQASLLDNLRWLWAWPTFMGLVFWLGIFMRRVNAWGAGAAFAAAAAMYLCCTLIPDTEGIRAFLSTGFGRFILYPLYLRIMEGAGKWSVLPWQMLYYLSAGLIAGIGVSLITPAPDKKKMDDFYLTISTPIGEDEKLKEAGVEILYK